jgi:hypothetical protein
VSLFLGDFERGDARLGWESGGERRRTERSVRSEGGWRPIVARVKIKRSITDRSGICNCATTKPKTCEAWMMGSIARIGMALSLNSLALGFIASGLHVALNPISFVPRQNGIFWGEKKTTPFEG